MRSEMAAEIEAGKELDGLLAAPPQRLGMDDQAEGLRRLLVRNQLQVVTLVAGKSGMGRTSGTINLATALANAGKDVLVLDENPAPHNLPDHLGLFARYDLLDVVQGRCSLRDAMVTGKGYMILPTAKAMRVLNKLSLDEQATLEATLTEATEGVDVLLVDAVVGQAAISSSLASGARVLVVMEATASGITESYSLIKRLALEHARQRFEIVVNKVADEAMAELVFGNIEKVARSNLAVRLDYLGCVPLDDKQKRATRLGRSVVESYPLSDAAKSYAVLAQSVLRTPLQQDEADWGISQMIRNLIRQLHHEQAAVA